MQQYLQLFIMLMNKSWMPGIKMLKAQKYKGIACDYDKEEFIRIN
jgi:hypothetical protein